MLVGTGMTVRVQVDEGRRAGAMRHHTGTHLLHAALRDVLGTHVKQAGSLVAPDRLRFDFSHFAQVSPRELRHLENRVNAEILRDARLSETVMGREEALASGALAFFGDKYGERVRVVEVPGFSKEFCGGTHVGATGEIGLFLLTDEEGVSAGTRRVAAVAGVTAALSVASFSHAQRAGQEAVPPGEPEAIKWILDRMEEAVKNEHAAGNRPAWRDAHALTTWIASVPSARSHERRMGFPSRAITSPATVDNALIQVIKACWSAVGSSTAKTRPKVSCDGIPCASSKNSANNEACVSPHGAISTQF